MQRDFHFYCIAVAARCAGFDSQDALTVAYASQYVDDSTESEKMTVDVNGYEWTFDPTRTAYDVFREDGWEEWSGQKRVLIPFHFMPPAPFDPSNTEPFRWVTSPPTQADSDCLTLQALCEAMNAADRTRRLCGLGIAIHTLADTWSHAHFSGRWEPAENDVENIWLYDPGSNGFDHPFFENCIYDPLKEIGHAECGMHPDLSFEDWKCDLPGASNVGRSNSVEFLKAADFIYSVLCTYAASFGNGTAAVPADCSWNGVRGTIGNLLAARPTQGGWTWPTISSVLKHLDGHLDEHCMDWQNAFANLFAPTGPFSYSYDKRIFRATAFSPNDTDWDGWHAARWGRPLTAQPGFWNSAWVHFHKAALHQRHFVLERLP